jgi:UDP-glucose 4-epimerase
MKILVTGGAGFIGSHSVDHLLAEGHSVRVFDNLCTGSTSNLDLNRVEMIVGDVRDKEAAYDAAIGCDAILHLSALVSVPESLKSPLETYAVNTMGTINFLEAAKRLSIKRFVMASTCAVYGDKPFCCSEESETSPLVPYATSKLMAEQAATDYALSFGLKVVKLRYYNVFGSRQLFESTYSGVIARWSNAIMAGEPCIIFGDGNQVREFISVYDVARFNVFSLTNYFDEPSPCFNISTGIPISLNQLLDVFEQVTQNPVKREYLPSRNGDIYYSSCNNSKILGIGWKTKVSLHDGLKKILNA